MAVGSSKMAPRTAVDIVRDLLEQGPPAGLRLGSPQTAGRLTLLPVFHDGPALEYVTFADAHKDGTAEITEVGGDGAVSTLEVKTSSKVPVLMIDGEILIGLKQNRVLNTTILVPAKTTLKVPGTRPQRPAAPTMRSRPRFAR